MFANQLGLNGTLTLYTAAANTFGTHRDNAWKATLNDEDALKAVREMLHSSLRMGEGVLRELGVEADVARDHVERFADHDDRLLAAQYLVQDDEAGLHSTLGQQLDICASYLELMRLRMGGRLGYAVEADADLRGRPFPPLLLITLVFNILGSCLIAFYTILATFNQVVHS